MKGGGNSGAVVREAGPLDVPVIAVLHAECFADGMGGAVWSETAIARVLSLPGSYGYLATMKADDGAKDGDLAPLLAPVLAPVLAPLGFLLARAVSGQSEILSLGVVSVWRRRGTARALLHAAFRRAGDAGAERTRLEVAEDNLAARALYAAEGFTVVTRYPAYYRRIGGLPAAALVFARRLPPIPNLVDSGP